ncbi:MAG TPA: 50S ribosomal protein L10 [Candidatus Dormibacteraeota bacterium]|nr:50S ribosomal protein L10 [Candidatus Dormibacteraeota bacterium]
MALSKSKKKIIFDDVSKILDESKLTVIAKYSGTPVKTLQELRKNAKLTSTNVKVYKNRIVLKALENNSKFKNIDTSLLNGMLIYASNNIDDLASAKVIAEFAKKNPTLEIIGSINIDGQLLNAVDTQELATIPPMEILIAQLVGTLSAPFGGLVNVISGNVRSVLNVLNARMEQVK